jgi:hypothetical protein
MMGTCKGLRLQAGLADDEKPAEQQTPQMLNAEARQTDAGTQLRRSDEQSRS